MNASDTSDLTNHHFDDQLIASTITPGWKTSAMVFAHRHFIWKLEHMGRPYFTLCGEDTPPSDVSRFADQSADLYQGFLQDFPLAQPNQASPRPDFSFARR